MTFFDIQSLFTSMPSDKKIHICINTVFQNKKKIKRMLYGQLKQLFELTEKSPCFTVNNVNYKQIDGVAMDSPLGPTFAKLLLVYYEDMWLDKLLFVLN